MLPHWLHRALMRCSSPVAPATAFVLTLDSSTQAPAVLTGRAAGEAFRRSSGLDRIPNHALIVVRRSERVYAVSTSFWMGLMEPRIRAAGDPEVFQARHRWQLPTLDHQAIDLCLARVLLVPAAAPGWLGRWRRTA